jgi:hypothetical protein
MAGLVSLSPISAVVATEANYQASGNLLALAIGPGAGPASAVFPAPFLVLCVVYGIASAALFWLAARKIGA